MPKRQLLAKPGQMTFPFALWVFVVTLAEDPEWKNKKVILKYLPGDDDLRLSSFPLPLSSFLGGGELGQVTKFMNLMSW